MWRSQCQKYWTWGSWPLTWKAPLRVQGWLPQEWMQGSAHVPQPPHTNTRKVVDAFSCQPEWRLWVSNVPTYEGYNYLGEQTAWNPPSPSSEDFEKQQSALLFLLAGVGACHSLHVRTHSPNDFEGSLNDSFMPGWDWPGFHLQPTTCTHIP